MFTGRIVGERQTCLYYRFSWFVKNDFRKNRLVELNETINWKPKSTEKVDLCNWLENVNDWDLSRSRYWEFFCQFEKTKRFERTKVIIL